MRSVLTLAILGWAVLAPSGAARAQQPSADAASSLPIIDAHSQLDPKVDPETILDLLDRSGVSRVLLASRAEGADSVVLELVGRHPDRITASIRSKGPDYQHGDSRFYARLAEAGRRTTYGALAELLVTHAPHRHAQLHYPGLKISLDDPRITAGIGVARARGWPLILHIEFGDLGSQAPGYMRQLEKLLAGHPSLKVGLIHMGQLEAGEVARLIAAHPNVFFLTSWADPLAALAREKALKGEIVAQTGWINMFQGTELKPEWSELMIRYPDRFVLAFDNVFPPHWGVSYLRKVEHWRRALAGLPAEVAHQVAHGNAERLWQLPPAKLVAPRPRD